MRYDIKTEINLRRFNLLTGVQQFQGSWSYNEREMTNNFSDSNIIANELLLFDCKMYRSAGQVGSSYWKNRNIFVFNRKRFKIKKVNKLNFR